MVQLVAPGFESRLPRSRPGRDSCVEASSPHRASCGQAADSQLPWWGLAVIYVYLFTFVIERLRYVRIL